MSTVPLRVRHPLGLPAGSIRAFVALVITLSFWLVLLLPDRADPERGKVFVPLHLYFLLGLVGLFFVSRGEAGAEAGGARSRIFGIRAVFIRLFLAVGTAGLLVWKASVDYPALVARLTPDANLLQTQWVPLLISAVVGFTVGYLLGLGPWRGSSAFQDLQAWLATATAFILAIDLLYIVFIGPSLRQEFDPSPWRNAIVAVVAGYFGVRAPRHPGR